MKKLLLVITLCCLIALPALTGCSDTDDTGSATPLDAAASVSQASASSAATNEHPTVSQSADNPDDESDLYADPEAVDPNVEMVESGTSGGSDSYYSADELIRNNWTLSKVMVNGSEKPATEFYGSVIKDTGAYIIFSKDGDFNCVIGAMGCSGTYSYSDNGPYLHFTAMFDGTGKARSCNEDQYLSCNTADGTIQFNCFGAINIFSQWND